MSNLNLVQGVYEAFAEGNVPYKATGKICQANFAHVWTLRGGKANRFVQYADTLLVQRALQT